MNITKVFIVNALLSIGCVAANDGVPCVQEESGETMVQFFDVESHKKLDPLLEIMRQELLGHDKLAEYMSTNGTVDTELFRAKCRKLLDKISKQTQQAEQLQNNDAISSENN